MVKIPRVRSAILFAQAWGALLVERSVGKRRCGACLIGSRSRRHFPSIANLVALRGLPFAR
ncbi:hypothetical protein B5F40_12500 [Gordonibacter sp. An230]|nr:hypothetical protein B5F40_12500 [Gordonibacter sp. An230]